MISVSWELACQQPAIWEFSVDGEPWRRIHRCIVGRRLRFAKSYPDLESWEAAFSEVEAERAKLYAYRRLAQRSFRAGELQSQLEQKGVSSQIAESIISQLRELGWLPSDEDWIQQFIEGQVRRYYGPRRVTQKLMIKGLAYEQAREAVDQFFSELDQEELMAHWIKGMRGLDPSKAQDRIKIHKRLLSKGFTPSF